MINFVDAEPPIEPIIGQLMDNITFLCEGPGDVSILLYDGDLNLLDTQLIHQIPEPGTIALLGLGALILKRRR